MTGKNITQVVEELCLGLLDTTRVISRGHPNFRVANKTFAIYQINHHGDGRIALWLRSPPGSQQFYVAENPACYFVPPYVGPSGWLGVELDAGLHWDTIGQRVFEAYCQVAPAKIAAQQPPPLPIEPPTKALDPALVDPFQQPMVTARREQIADYCLGLPETRADQQFGAPSFKAGKKTFCTLHFHQRRLELSVWVGPEEQFMRTIDPRYRIPQYIGHRGWLNLDIHEALDMTEVTELILGSYRHFALKRMLAALGNILNDE